MQTKRSIPRFGGRTLSLVIAVALTGIALSVFIRIRMADSEVETARLMAESLKTNTEQELLLFQEVLESVRALHALSDAVDQEAMTEFIAKGMVHQQNILGGFGLAQRIGPQLREVMENEARSELRSGYLVQQRSSDKTWVPSPKKSVYYPLTWKNRPAALNIPVGYDFSSEPENMEAIQKIEQTGKTVLAQAPAFFSTPDAPAYWAFSPVIPVEFQSLPFVAPGSVIGFAVSALEPKKLLDQVLLSAALPDGLKLKLYIREQEQPATTRYTGGRWVHQSTLNAMGAAWTFECTLPSAAIGRRADLALALGLLITAFLSTKLLLLGNRAQAIEAEVQVRTKELKEANEQLEKNIQIQARLEEEMNEITANEQRRIGRDLHDSLGQKLTGAVFLSRSLLNWLEKHGEQKTEISNRQPAIDHQKAHAETLNETLKSAVSQVRNMARGLASVTLNNNNLEESLEQLADEMSALYNINCSFSKNGTPGTLDRETKEQLYFIAREAINNAARHAQASSIEMNLSESNTEWRLKVRDNGIGMETPHATEKGLGLRIMRHRANRIGAEFTIHSSPGKGTTIEVTS